MMPPALFALVCSYGFHGTSILEMLGDIHSGDLAFLVDPLCTLTMCRIFCSQAYWRSLYRRELQAVCGCPR